MERAGGARSIAVIALLLGLRTILVMVMDAVMMNRRRDFAWRRGFLRRRSFRRRTSLGPLFEALRNRNGFSSAEPHGTHARGHVEAGAAFNADRL